MKDDLCLVTIEFFTMIYFAYAWCTEVMFSIFIFGVFCVLVQLILPFKRGFVSYFQFTHPVSKTVRYA